MHNHKNPKIYLLFGKIKETKEMCFQILILERNFCGPSVTQFLSRFLSVPL